MSYDKRPKKKKHTFKLEGDRGARIITHHRVGCAVVKSKTSSWLRDGLSIRIKLAYDRIEDLALILQVDTASSV